MIITINMPDRKIVVVHNADPDGFKELIANVIAGAYQACKAGEMVLMLADFTYEPIIPMHLATFSNSTDTIEALKLVKAELYEPDTVFAGVDYIQEHTGSHPRDILAKLVESL